MWKSALGVIALLGSLLPAASALAQTGASLLLKPWEQYGSRSKPTEARAEFHGDAFLYDETNVSDTGERLTLSEFDSHGRYKLSANPGAGPAVGYDLLYLDLDTGDSTLPDRLLDVSVAAAGGARLSPTWRLGVVGGVGYAGVRPFADSESAYFTGDLILVHDIDDDTSLTFLLTYDGNRTLWPDVPLPAVSYAHRVNDQLSYTLGLPYSSVTYHPATRWKLSAAYTIPYTFDLTAEYELADNLHAFGRFDNRYDAFWIEDRHNRRIFFQQRRAELGLRYGAADRADLTLAAGYAFSQRFDLGWDVLDVDTLRDIDPEPYLRLALDLRF